MPVNPGDSSAFDEVSCGGVPVYFTSEKDPEPNWSFADRLLSSNL